MNGMRRYGLICAAVLSLSAAAQINTPDNRGLISLGRQFAQENNFAAALDRLRLIDRQALPPDERRAVDLDEAKWLFEACRYDEARLAFSNFTCNYPDAPEYNSALRGVGDCLFAIGDYAKALDNYNKVNVNALGYNEAAGFHYRRGVCLMETGQAAEATFRQALRYPTVASASAFYLGKIAFEAGNYSDARTYFARVNPTVSPGDMAAVYSAAIDFAEGKYRQALSTARAALNHNYTDRAAVAELNRIAGESLYRTGKRSEACTYLQKYVDATAEALPSALYILALEAFDKGDYSGALALFQSVAERGEGKLRQSAYLFAGQCLLEEGDSHAAILAFDKAARSNDDPAVREAALYNYAAAKFAGASVPFASSAEVFEQFLNDYPSGPYSDRVASYLAQGYMADNDYGRALERLDAITAPSPRMLAAKQRVLYTLGLKALNEKDLASAEAYLARAEKLREYDPAMASEVALAQGEVLLAQNNANAAAGKFRYYLRTASSDSPNRATAGYGLAYALYKGGDGKGAATYFTKAAEELPSPAAKADALNRLGDIQFGRADFAGAAAYYDRAFRTNPSAGDYAALSASNMKGYMRDYQGKIAGLEKFRRDFPTSVLMPDALLELTQAQISSGRNDDAIATYRTLIADYPRTSQGRRGYLQMAMTLLDMGREHEAEEAYRSVIRLYPTSEEAVQASSLLKNLCADSGRGSEYLDFISGIDNAPKISENEAEAIAYQSAMAAFSKNGSTAQLENFVSEYPSSANAAAALGLLFDEALKKGKDSEASALADRIINRYPDSETAEKALLYKADKVFAAGELPEAVGLYRTLAEKASDVKTATSARLGLMRAARDIGDNSLAGATADAIIASSAGPSAISEARFTKAIALYAEDKTDEALEIWTDMASAPSDLYGARSAYEAAATLHSLGKEKEALDLAQKFVKSGSPHRYWVARGFILLSDIFKAQGKDFEAREYLEALRDNYPGKEPDIFTMIEQRLANK